jgi:hypothetical protein
MESAYGSIEGAYGSMGGDYGEGAHAEHGGAARVTGAKGAGGAAGLARTRLALEAMRAELVHARKVVRELQV